MANLDTVAKRHSGLSVNQPWRTAPIPSGTVNRQATALMYSGVTAENTGLPPDGPGLEARALDDRLWSRASDDRLHARTGTD